MASIKLESVFCRWTIKSSELIESYWPLPVHSFLQCLQTKWKNQNKRKLNCSTWIQGKFTKLENLSSQWKIFFFVIYIRLRCSCLQIEGNIVHKLTFMLLQIHFWMLKSSIHIKNKSSIQIRIYALTYLIVFCMIDCSPYLYSCSWTWIHG